MHKPFLRFASSFIFVALVVSACADMTVDDTGATQESVQATSQPEVQKAQAAPAGPVPAQPVGRSMPTGSPLSGGEALRGLPRYPYGDGVDWVKALRTGRITPHATVSGAGEQGIMDVDVPISVKGTMANVVFPHKAHTEWLACGNCHVGLYQMQRGVNAVGMAKIAQGESCGVCHGAVAFPLDDCQRCHSQPKKGAKP